ncbi:hypothetical protein AUEXF2481DRAFT_40088 [Aureobasidium subglaciale EXF-2481]|uniref:Uncharacterized protein n=1 Tax=Aureobasidium subglaciale (strain EXF-2481) TaxID=1043005 RepID=A0A074YHG0_AURSE|nr:uncharacterized protein AUEXF2481DRAFT_40088 [Aureobasidium subglaciale EXF-2481]KEQ95519.1 hypothetical protein AUEXF2481DRAFT_40088 [Aureobasidium subglaciale EXF-2481]
MLYALLIDGNADVERTEQQQTKPVSDASEYELRQGREVFHITGNSNDERATRRWEWTALCLSPDGDDLGVMLSCALTHDYRPPSGIQEKSEGTRTPKISTSIFQEDLCTFANRRQTFGRKSNLDLQTATMEDAVSLLTSATEGATLSLETSLNRTEALGTLRKKEETECL